jgi:hypothetical protein
MAQDAGWGILIARTDPDAPKHDGISYFMLDMKTPGIDIRPLRELTGEAWFNEVFFNDVFVPDECLVGGEHDGWRAARTTLANERVYMGSGSSIGYGVQGVLQLLDAAGLASDPVALDEAGGWWPRSTRSASSGSGSPSRRSAAPIPTGRRRRFASSGGGARPARVRRSGSSCSAARAPSPTATRDVGAGLPVQPVLTIAGGTSEVQRNVIAERLLGLPRPVANLDHGGGSSRPRPETRGSGCPRPAAD